MSESMKYTPEEVLETTGPNTGNIKDIELAQVGAEAENKRRKSLGYKFDKFSGAVEGDKMNWPNKVADQKSMEAMKKEIEVRAARELVAGGASRAGAQRGGEKAAMRFKAHQEAYTEKRVDNEAENLRTGEINGNKPNHLKRIS